MDDRVYDLLIRGNESYTKQEYNEAFRAYSEAYSLAPDDRYVCVNLGNCFYYGLGCGVDHKKAFELYEVVIAGSDDLARQIFDFTIFAADNGNSYAQKLAGDAFLWGYCCEVNTDKSIHYYQMIEGWDNDLNLEIKAKIVIAKNYEKLGYYEQLQHLLEHVEDIQSMKIKRMIWYIGSYAYMDESKFCKDTRKSLEYGKKAFMGSSGILNVRLLTALQIRDAIEEEIINSDDLIYAGEVVDSFTSDGNYVEAKRIIHVITRCKSEMKLIEDVKQNWKEKYQYVLSFINNKSLMDIKRNADNGDLEAARQVALYYVNDYIGEDRLANELHYCEILARSGDLKVMEYICSEAGVYHSIELAMWELGERNNSQKIISGFEYIYKWRLYEYNLLKSNPKSMTMQDGFVDINNIRHQLDELRYKIASFLYIAIKNSDKAWLYVDRFNDTPSAIIRSMILYDKAVDENNYEKIKYYAEQIIAALQDKEFLKLPKPYHFMEAIVAVALLETSNALRLLWGDTQAAAELLLTCREYLKKENLLDVVNDELDHYYQDRYGNICYEE